MTIKTRNNAMKTTRIETARKILNERITPEMMSQIIAHTQEKMLFLERSSEYSDGSALFMIYEREVTSLSSLIIP